MQGAKRNFIYGRPVSRHPAGALLIICSLFLCSACSNISISAAPVPAKNKPLFVQSADDDVFDQKLLAISKPKNRVLALVSIDLDGRHETDPLVLSVRRQDKAYLVEAPIYQSEQTKATFSFGYDRQQHVTAGVRMRWNF